MKHMIMLVGLPGAGKSTLAKKYIEEGYKWVNQDTLGTRQECIKVASYALVDGQNVIIDRTNISQQQRKYWIQIAKKFNVDKITCIVLRVDRNECIERIAKRTDHPNLNDKTELDKIKQIVDNFNSGFEMPQTSEGIDEIIVLDSTTNTNL